MSFYSMHSHFSKCGVSNPSWMELKHFLSFLNAQFEDCENSIFCNSPFVKQDLPGFKAFVVKFMLKMSKVSSVLRNMSLIKQYLVLIFHMLDLDFTSQKIHTCVYVHVSGKF